MMQGMTGPYVTSGTAAKAIGVHPVTLVRWAKAGRVKAAVRTPGGQFRWDLDDLRRQLSGAGGHDETAGPASEGEP